MKKRNYIYRCSSCGHEELKWLGRCPECGEWNTLTETAIGKTAGVNRGRKEIPQSIPLLAVDPMDGNRISSGIAELDRVLGGGIIKRSAVLIGGEPGIGKSTLLLQIAALVLTKGRILYISGEESPGQIKMRAERLGLLKQQAEKIELFCSGSLEEIQTILEAVKPVLVIVDSAQTLHSEEAGISAYSITQMKYCSLELINWVKEHDSCLFLAAHVTKDGIIAGPKSLEHLVDTVLYFEGNTSSAGDSDCRFLYSVKNRFGSVEEIGIFTMGEKGLVTMEDPSVLFLVRRETEQPAGVATAAVLEGSRTFMVEIQALTVPAKGGMSRVFSERIDNARVSRIAASIEKHLGLRLSDQDIYINVAGGIRITEVGVDLALACAIYSARSNIPLPAKTIVAGELTLAGEIRPLRRLQIRVKTALNLGFSRIIGPKDDSITIDQGKGYIGVDNIKTAIKAVFPQ